jgi:hypothetical protein
MDGRCRIVNGRREEFRGRRTVPPPRIFEGNFVRIGIAQAAITAQAAIYAAVKLARL